MWLPNRKWTYENVLCAKSPREWAKAGVPKSQDLMPDDLRWNSYNSNRNKVHNKCSALESSQNHPLYPRHLVCVCVLSRVWLCDPMDDSSPGSYVHEILQARILECVSLSFSSKTFLTLDNYEPQIPVQIEQQNPRFDSILHNSHKKGGSLDQLQDWWHWKAKICYSDDMWTKKTLGHIILDFFKIIKTLKKILFIIFGCTECSYYTRAFYSCGKWELFFLALFWLLIAAASLIMEHGL